jgi:hypothetical protein
MRTIIIGAALIGVALGTAGLCASSFVAGAEDAIPKRKPGLWEITTVAPVSGMTKGTTCVGADDLVTLEGGDCTKPKTTPLMRG